MKTKRTWTEESRMMRRLERMRLARKLRLEREHQFPFTEEDWVKMLADEDSRHWRVRIGDEAVPFQRMRASV